MTDGIAADNVNGCCITTHYFSLRAIDNINDIHTTYMKQIAFGKYTGTAEEIVAEYQDALKKAGIDDVTAALQAQFDALYK